MVINPVIKAASGSESTSAVVAAHPIDEKASAKVASRDEVCRRRNWLRRAWTRRALGMASHQFHLGSRGFALGALLSAAVGVLASVPLVARTIFPRLTARARKRFGRIVQTSSTPSYRWFHCSRLMP